MDDEADELEIRRVLRTLSSTEQDNARELMASWHRYHHVRAVLSDKNATRCSAGFMDSIRAEIDKQPVPERKGNGELESAVAESANEGRFNWLSAFGQGAIAASVAALVLVFSWNALSPAPGAAEGPAASIASRTTSQTGPVQFTGVSNNFSGKLDDDSLAFYVWRHNGFEPFEMPAIGQTVRLEAPLRR